MSIQGAITIHMYIQQTRQCIYNPTLWAKKIIWQSTVLQKRVNDSQMTIKTNFDLDQWFSTSEARRPTILDDKIFAAHQAQL